MVRGVRPKTFVKIVDACSAGTPLVKSHVALPPIAKDAFDAVYQFASCRQDQVSFGGEPLSVFTRAFLDACVRKVMGPVYYNDLVNTLRDDFLDNNEQTPHFVQQGSGREQLVDDVITLKDDDVITLKDFRVLYAERWPAGNDAGDGEGTEAAGTGLIIAEPAADLTPIQILKVAETRLVSPEAAASFVATLFNGVLARFGDGEFGDAFDVAIKEHARFADVGSRDFIARTLAREPRHDALVTAEVRHEMRQRKRTVWEEAMGTSLFSPSREEMIEIVDLELNCRMDRAQVQVVLTPRYRMLQRLILTLTCAPSLERCFVFERLTRHDRSDWEDFESGGREMTRRWYRMTWDADLSSLVEKIASNVEEHAQQHIEAVAKRLSGE
jgi:hypothetical protein